jgi:hypothetical protein
MEPLVMTIMLALNWIFAFLVFVLEKTQLFVLL